MKAQFIFAAASLFLGLPSLAAETYEVPLESVDQSFRIFELQNLATTSDAIGTMETISYDIPHDLVGGRNVRIELTLESEQALGMKTFAGPLGQAACVDRSPGLMCMVKYDPVVADHLDNNLSYLRQKYLDQSLDSRLAVAKVFAHEAIGIVKISGDD